MSSLARFGRALLAGCVLAISLRAQSSLNFDAPEQLDLLSLATSGNAALVHASTGGAGSPATGGLRFVASGTGDDRIVSAWRTQTYGFDTAASLTTSALVHLGSIAGEEGEFKLGFTNPAAVSVPPTDKDFLKKKGALTYLSGILKYKRKDGQIETLIANKASASVDGSEFSKLTATVTSAQMDAWLRLTFTVTPLAETPGSFSARLLIENLGADGLAAPTVVRDFTVSPLPNATVASASAGRVALSFYTKKQPLAEPRLDNWSAVVPGPPPAAPLATEATLLGSTQFDANWQAPVGGVSSYTLEVSPASANFAAEQTTSLIIAAPATTATVANLSPVTAYVYRLRATNDNGPGPLSNVVSVTTLASGVNAPPTLDPVADLGLLAPSPSLRLISLTGLSAGPGESQPLTLTATSSAPALVPHPTVAYTDPSSTAELSLLAPGPGVGGPVTITVTVSDGTNSVSRTFTLTVRAAPEVIGFASATEYADEFIGASAQFTPAWSATSGTGTPAGGGLQLALPSATGDRTYVAWRTQPVVPADATGLSSSIRFQLAGLVKEGEVRVGFAADATPGEPADKEYLKKASGPHRSISAFAKLKQDKDQIEVGLLNRTASATATEIKITLPAALSALLPAGDWARLTLHLNRNTTTGYTARYVLENLGPDGAAASPVLIAEGTPEALVNATLALSVSAHPVFLVTAKADDSGPFRFDDHEAFVLTQPPLAPEALAATERTSASLRAVWTYSASAPFATGYIVEVSTAADNFAPGTLLAADGTPGQSTGISVAGSATSLTLVGLAPATAYRYRLRAANAAGSGPLSNVIEAVTLPVGGNSLPTLDAFADLLLAPDAPARLVALAGLGAGGELGQTVTVTATSSAPALLPHPVIQYTSPAATGTLTLAPTGASGSATITVTVNDGFDTLTRSFTVTLAAPPVIVGFETPAELAALIRHVVHGSLVHAPAAGLGSPASGAAYFLGDGLGTDNAALVLRPQDYPGSTATLLRTSLVLNPREIDEVASHKAELRLGFADLATAPADLKKFFDEGRNAVFAKLTAEHKPAENKAHLLKVRLGITSPAGGKSESAELSRTDALAYGHWLRLHLDAVPLGATQIRLVLRLEDLGADGLAAPSLLATQTSTFTHAGFLAAPRLHAGFFLNTEKTVGTHGFWIDDHRVEVSTAAPSAPLILPALQTTSRSFFAAWSPATDGPPPSAYELQVSTAADNFAPGTLLAADGTPGQSAAIAIAGTATTLRIANLDPSTTYVYRVRGLNRAGPGPLSATHSLTTLGIDGNLPPTLDTPADVEIAVGTLDRELALTGITDGGEDDQALFVYATSSNPALLPAPYVIYGSPDTTARLFLDPAPGLTGTASITVFVDDGASQDYLVERTFTVSVVSPVPLLRFDTSTDLGALSAHTSEAALVHAPAAGLPGTPGALRFERSAIAQDHVAVAFRRTGHDARTSPGFTTSVLVNLATVLAVTGDKDQAEVRLGFVGSDQPATTLKNTLAGGAPALGLVFKLEHQPASTDKLRRLTAQLYQRAGTTTTTGTSLGLSDTDYAAHWLRLEFHAVRTNDNSGYLLHYTVDSYGTDGLAFVARIFTGEPLAVFNPDFALDDSVYAALQFSGEKSAATAFLADDFSAHGYPLAPDAPPLGVPTGLSAGTATLAWAEPALGTVATGYVVELSRAEDWLALGTFITLAGQGGQSSGVAITGYSTLSAAFSGLAPGTSYLWRVRAVGGGGAGPAFPARVFTTDAAPPAPGYATWGAARFDAGQLATPAVSGPLADPDADGLPNLLEYAFGGSPLAPDAASVSPQALAMVGARLRLSYRRHATATDLAYVPESTGDLSGPWSAGTSLEISATAPDSDGYQTIVIEDAIPLDASNRARFLRVRVLRAE